MSFRILHAADLHLSYRYGQRVTSTGINQREADVGRTFTALIDAAIALQPDAFVVAGDCFDRVNPGNPAIIHAYSQLARLRAALPKCITILIAGNHEAPKTAAAGCVLPLFLNLGVHIVDRAPQRLRFADRGLSVLCVPDLPGMTRPALTPDPTARLNLLLLHGEMQGMPRKGGDRSHEISHDESHIVDWDYIALGHYHVMHAIAANCYYPGSTDFTSSDPWGELKTGVPKGFIIRDLESGVHEFHPLPVSRVYQDLQSIEALGLSASEIDSALAERLTGLDGIVARLVITNIDKATQHALDQEPIRLAKRAALHLHIDYRRPERVRRDLATAPRSRGISLSELVARKLTERTTDLPADRLADVAMTYLAQAGEALPVETITEQLTEAVAA